MLKPNKVLVLIQHSKLIAVKRADKRLKFISHLPEKAKTNKTEVGNLEQK